MKKIFALLLVLALTIAVATALADDDKNFVLTFTSNPTTGYDWNYVVLDDEVVAVEAVFAMTDKEILEFWGDEVPAGEAEEEMLPGQGGIQFFRISGLKPGETVIALDYKQGDDDDSIVVALTYTLKVADDLSVTAVSATAGV